MARMWNVTSSIAIALTIATVGTVAGAIAPAQAEPAPDVVWMVGPAQNVEIVSGEIQDIVGDRARLLLTDGSSRLVGLTQVDRTRLGLDPGDQITVALVDGRFFAQAVALGTDALLIRNGYIQLASVDGISVSSSSGSTVTRSTVVTQGSTVQGTTTVRGTTTVQGTTTVTTEQPAQPIRGMW